MSGAEAALQAREPSARYLDAVQPALVRQFELLATAPGGVARLRELILTLAVQGKLVARDPGDEPASALLTRVRAPKARMVSAGDIRAGKSFADVTEDERPFSLPTSWVWARFGDATINRDGERIPVSSNDREQRARSMTTTAHLALSTRSTGTSSTRLCFSSVKTAPTC